MDKRHIVPKSIFVNSMTLDEVLTILEYLNKMASNDLSDVLAENSNEMFKNSSEARRMSWVGDVIHSMDVRLGVIISSYGDGNLQPTAAKHVSNESMSSFAKIHFKGNNRVARMSVKQSSSLFEMMYSGEFRRNYIQYTFGENSFVSFVLTSIDLSFYIAKDISDSVFSIRNPHYDFDKSRSLIESLDDYESRVSAPDFGFLLEENSVSEIRKTSRKGKEKETSEVSSHAEILNKNLELRESNRALISELGSLREANSELHGDLMVCQEFIKNVLRAVDGNDELIKIMTKIMAYDKK